MTGSQRSGRLASLNVCFQEKQSFRIRLLGLSTRTGIGRKRPEQIPTSDGIDIRFPPETGH